MDLQQLELTEKGKKFIEERNSLKAAYLNKAFHLIGGKGRPPPGELGGQRKKYDEC